MPQSSLRVPEGYRALSEVDLGPFLATTPLAQVLGGGPADWIVREVGDGNLNLVSIVSGPAGGIAVKQAVPYVRLVGESWPLPLDRAHFEHLALLEQARHAADRVPRVLYYQPELALLALELLAPHVILRRGMIQGIRYPLFARHIATFVARTAFYTSDLALASAAKRELWERFAANTALCKISEDLIFTEPYIDAVNNRWTSPQLDADVRAIRGDVALKIAICELKEIFLCSAQALIHGDLHTGSIMVTAEDTRVIDPEFAFCGPIGFDVGALLGNLLLNYFSQAGHATAGDSRREYGEWVLEQVRDVWLGFAQEFRTLWDKEHAGDAYPSSFFAGDRGALGAAQDRYLGRLFQDSLGFAGAKMIRRILGLAHNIDLEWIENPERRANCERECLELARYLVVERSSIPDIAAVVSAARTIGERRSR